MDWPEKRASSWSSAGVVAGGVGGPFDILGFLKNNLSLYKSPEKKEQC